jgi:serine/threonine-protein kinase
VVVAGQLTGYRLSTESSYDGLLAVSHAVQESDGTEVTVHVVVADLNRTQLRRVRDEAAALDNVLAASNNPFVLPLIDHGRDSEGRPFFVTALRGRSLADELAERGPLPYAEARSAVLEAATGLELLHRQGMVHQRISPVTLLRQPTGRVVVDCPLLPVLAELATTLTEGTGHEPLEVLSGQDWTPPGEVYALASTLWTLLSGRSLFPGSRAERLLPMLSGLLPPLRLTDVPDGLTAALDGALASEPGSRPKSMAAFARCVQDAEHDRESARQRTSVGQQTRPPTAEQRRLGSEYLLLSPIGTGSSGTVWRARRRVDGALVAAKVLHPQLVTDADTLTRLVREGFQAMVHPNLVQVLDLYIDRGRGQAAVIMDLVDGVDLRQLLTSGQLGRAEGMRLLSEVASGLSAVHAKGVVHRDLKPENILVRDLAGRHTALLTDFGLARAIDQPTVTRSGQVPGTPAYLAPELINGASPSPASDVYALGVTAYEVLAGCRPFSGSTEEVLRQHRSEPPARPADVHDQAWTFLEACLAKDPRRRPDALDASDILSGLAREVALAGPERAAPDLERTITIAVPAYPPWQGPAYQSLPDPIDVYATGTPAAQPTETSSKPPQPAPVPPTPRRSRRQWLILAGCLLAVSAAGSAIGVRLARSTPEPSPDTPEPQAHQIAAEAKAGPGGQVIVTWPKKNADLPSLKKYLVLRNNIPVGEARKEDSSYQDLAAGGTACYQVFALGVTAPAPNPPPPPACVPNR